jgi:pentapeptide repeat protein
MANDEDLARLRQGAAVWNAWRRGRRVVDLSGADLSWVNLRGACLSGADLLSANLVEANLVEANLARANLRGAILHGACLSGADLSEAILSEADLAGADLEYTSLINTDLTDADLTGCRVYGNSAWDLKLEGAKQRDLVITKADQPEITVDNIEVGQFIYLLLNNEKIREVIDTIGKKGVLLLGRFTEGRLAVLERLRAELRKRDFVPMVFNFDKPETKDFTETVRLLAGLSRFVIADITNPRSAPLELQATVPEYMIPFVPVIEVGQQPFAMFQDLWVKHRAWVLDPIAYGSVEELVQGLDKEIIKPALARFDELLVKKAEKLRVRRIGT